MFHFLNGAQTRDFPSAGLRLAAAGMVALWLAGCGGKGESLHLDLRAAAPAAASAKSAGDLTVAVTHFDDSALASPKRLGSRAHLWGGTSHFDLADGKSGEAVARLVADALKTRGWRVAKAGADGKAQAEISGKILELSVNATSSFGSTDIVSTSKIVAEAVNAADGSKIRMTLTGKGAQTVFWFDPEDAQALLGETVSKNLDELIANIRVEGALLRLK